MSSRNTPSLASSAIWQPVGASSPIMVMVRSRKREGAAFTSRQRCHTPTCGAGARNQVVLEPLCTGAHSRSNNRIQLLDRGRGAQSGGARPLCTGAHCQPNNRLQCSNACCAARLQACPRSNRLHNTWGGGPPEGAGGRASARMVGCRMPLMSTKSRPMAWKGWLVRVWLQHRPSRTMLFHATDAYVSSCAVRARQRGAPRGVSDRAPGSQACAQLQHTYMHGACRQPGRAREGHLEAVWVDDRHVQRLVVEVEALKVQDALHQRLRQPPLDQVTPLYERSWALGKHRRMRNSAAAKAARTGRAQVPPVRAGQGGMRARARTGLCSSRCSGSQPAGDSQSGSSSTMITPDADVCCSVDEPFRCGWNLRRGARLHQARPRRAPQWQRAAAAAACDALARSSRR